MKNSYQDYISRAGLAITRMRFKEAAELLEKAIKLEPTIPSAYLLAGNCDYLQHRIDSAEQYYVKGSKLDPQDGEFYFCLGNCYLQKKFLADAVKYYSEALNKRCNDTTKQKTYYIMGSICEQSGDDEGALVNYEKAKKIRGANLDLANILKSETRLYVKHRDLLNAEKSALQLKLLQPTVFGNYQALFQIYLSQQKVNDAKNILNELKSLQLSKANQLTLHYDTLLLCCYLAEINSDKERDYYGMALKWADWLSANGDLSIEQRCDAAVARAEIYVKLKDYDNAIKYAEKIASNNDDKLEEYRERAKLVLLQSYEAQENFDKVCEYAGILKNSHNVAYRHKAYYAQAYATKMLARHTDHSKSSWNELYNIAIAYYRNSTATAPGDYLAYKYRTMSYADIGEFDKAEEIIKLLPEELANQLRNYVEKGRRET